MNQQHFTAAGASQLAGRRPRLASATVGLLGQEGPILRKTILPALYYVVVLGVLGLLAAYALDLADPLTHPPPRG